MIIHDTHASCLYIAFLCSSFALLLHFFLQRISKLKAALLNTIGVRGLPDKYSEEEKERIREQGPFLLEVGDH